MFFCWFRPFGTTGNQLPPSLHLTHVPNYHQTNTYLNVEIYNYIHVEEGLWRNIIFAEIFKNVELKPGSGPIEFWINHYFLFLCFKFVLHWNKISGNNTFLIFFHEMLITKFALGSPMISDFLSSFLCSSNWWFKAHGNRKRKSKSWELNQVVIYLDGGVATPLFN